MLKKSFPDIKNNRSKIDY